MPTYNGEGSFLWLVYICFDFVAERTVTTTRSFRWELPILLLTLLILAVIVSADDASLILFQPLFYVM
jgi:hypothetical protein